MTVSWFPFPLAGTRYTVRQRDGYITGATSEHGVHVEPGDLHALAAKHGQAAALDDALYWAGVDARADWDAERRERMEAA